jgi:hypothetical protein
MVLGMSLQTSALIHEMAKTTTVSANKSGGD